MKKTILSALAICAALLGCQKNEISELSLSGVDLHATIEDGASTKTVMDENNNIRWSEGDQIVAFMKTSLGLKYQIKPSYVGKTSGYFSKISSGSSDDLGAGMALDHNVAYYPYSDIIECQKSGSDYILNITLSSEQTYAAESFGNGFFPMVAVSENNNITFKNVCGGLKLQLKGTAAVKTIELKGNAGELLSGKASVTVYPDGTVPSIVMSSDASKSVILDCGAGVQLNEDTATEFILTVPPVAFDSGFTVTITDTQNGMAVLSTDKANPIKRSAILSMPVMEIETMPVFTPTEHSITATFEVEEDNTDVCLFEPFSLIGGEDNPVVLIDCGDDSIITIPQSNGNRHTYSKAGSYSVKYYFESPLDKIEDSAFAPCVNMTSIVVPSTVRSIGGYVFYPWFYGQSKLHTVLFEEDSQLEIIGEFAFSSTSISQFTIPSKVHTIGSYAFAACHNLSDFSSESQRFLPFTTGILGQRHSEGGYTLISYASGHTATEVSIDRIAFPVVAEGAISNCRNIRKISFKGELEYLGAIGHNCPNLEEVEGLELIGENSIFNASFSSTNLKSIRIPSNIISVGGFWDNKNLSEVIIDEGVRAINGRFASGTAVTSISIPSSVTSVADGVLCDCNQLSCITISSGVTSISSSFNNDSSIETVYVGAIVPPALSDSFDSISRDAVIYVPESSLEDYKSASGWSDFSDMLVPYDSHLNYIDEYGVDHGPGVKIGETVWAPVNCGYHATDYKYGKLYQWGRKYGQGYYGDLYLDGSLFGQYSDATFPVIVTGGVSVETGQDENNIDVFFTGISEYGDWLSPQDDNLWNLGTESNPIKTNYDPCPYGWRVPTYAELSELRDNYSPWFTDENGRSGLWLSGTTPYTSDAPQVFFPAAGTREKTDGAALGRGINGFYWASSTNAIYFNNAAVYGMGYGNRAHGYSVRCVQVTD